MSVILKAKIEWLTKEQGGRQTGIPVGDKYAPIINIKDQLYDIHKTNWSLFVNNQENIADYVTIAKIQYLSEFAPNNLKKGVEFELYEGTKLVAKGTVI